MIEATLEVVEAGGDLSMEAMSEAMGLIMEGRCPEEEIARLLAALHRKGETVGEVAGAAAAMRRQMTPIRTSRTDVIDVVGTGGDGSGTFNISTTAALVTAAAGVPVAKHGNRAVTSRTGSSDVLAALGVNIEADIERVEACLDELGICFCFAPLYHRAMQHVAPVRQKLGTPTIFNILGPLVNPAGAPFQLLGVGRPGLRPLLAEAIGRLGTRRTLVVHGADGLDEVSLGESTSVTEVSGGKGRPKSNLPGREGDSPIFASRKSGQSPSEFPVGGKLREFQWTAADFGLQPAGMETMLVENPQQSAEVVREILGGRTWPPRDIVVANAAAALWTAGRSDSPIECARLGAEAIDSGAAKDLLAQLARRTHA